MTRRELLSCLAAAPALSANARIPDSVLVHEHILVDFAGAARIGAGRYDRDDVFRIAKPRLEEIKALGCRRLLECTPNFVGRDALLCARLADATGIQIWTNTGLYGAGGAAHPYLPDFALRENAAQLASRWIAEAGRGVDGLKPRFIKIGVNKGPLDDIERKLVHAAARTSRETGLPIAAHTPSGLAAVEELEIIESTQVPASKFVWFHATMEKDHAYHEKVARAGAWACFDGVREGNAAWIRECLRFMAEKNLLGRVLVSNDAGWYHAGEPRGGSYRGYTFVYENIVAGLEPTRARQLLVENPVQAFGN
jgi:phosphotriesterase-related protein